MLRNTSMVLLLLGMVSPIWAQGMTSSGVFGSRSVGGSISAGTRNAFGSGGSLGMGAGSMGQQQTFGVTGNERFVRGNRTAAQFVGSDTTDSTFVGALSTGTTGMSGRGTGMTGGLGGSLGGGRGGLGGAMGLSGGMRGNQRTGQMGRGGMNNMGMGMGMGGRNNRQINVRTTLEVGFRYKALPKTQVHSNLVERLNHQRIGRLGTLEVELQDRVATLRGRVASEDDRDLAKRIAKMEPGVEEVVDLMTVDSSESTTDSPSDQQ